MYIYVLLSYYCERRLQAILNINYPVSELILLNCLEEIINFFTIQE